MKKLGEAEMDHQAGEAIIDESRESHSQRKIHSILGATRRAIMELIVDRP